MSENTQSMIPGFDLNALRLPQNFGESLGVKRLITRVPVRKPLKAEFFRVRTGEPALVARGRTLSAGVRGWRGMP